MRFISNRIIFVLSLLVGAIIANGQELGYVIQNNTYRDVMTIEYKAETNSKYCHYKNYEDAVEKKYSPEEIVAYGLPNGTVFVAKTIKIESGAKKVFLERLELGKLTFYYYGGKSKFKFFMEKDSVLVQLRKVSSLGTYREVLGELTNDCNSTKEAIEKVKFSKKSLAILTKLYNKCGEKSMPFPELKYGVVVGANVSSLSFNRELSHNNRIDNSKTEFNADVNLSYGLFIEYPLGLKSSFCTEIVINKNSYSHNEQSRVLNTEFSIGTNTKLNYTSIEIPLLYKYTFVESKLLPFYDFGLNYIRILDIDSYSVVSTLENSIVTEKKNDHEDKISTDFIGFSIGGGLKFKVYNNSYLSLKLQGNYNLGFKKILETTKSTTIKSLNFRVVYNF